MAKSTPIDPNNPKGTADPKKGDDQIRKTNAGAIEIVNVDHYVGANTADVGYDEDDAGKHSKIRFREVQTDLSLLLGADDKGVQAVKNDGTNAELFFHDKAGNDIQQTRGGKVNLDKNIIANDTPLQADNEAGDGFVPLIKAGRNEADDADVAVLPDAVRTATNAAPDEDTGVANKKFVEDSLTDAEGSFRFCKVNGADVKVYTKYLTGVLDSAATTNVAHGITGIDNILSVSASVFSSTRYSVSDYRIGAEASVRFGLLYDGTNVTFELVGSSNYGQKYRIKIDYILPE